MTLQTEKCNVKEIILFNLKSLSYGKAIVCACILLLAGCQNPPEAKSYACKEFSTSCELEKDFILIQPVAFDKKTTDVYGDPIMGRSDCRWYIIPHKTKIMIPVSFYVCTGYERSGEFSSPVYSKCPTAEQINNCQDVWRDMVKSDSVDLSLIIPGLTKAVVVVSGPNEILTTKIWPELAFAKKE